LQSIGRPESSWLDSGVSRFVLYKSYLCAKRKRSQSPPFSERSTSRKSETYTGSAFSRTARRFLVRGRHDLQAVPALLNAELPGRLGRSADLFAAAAQFL